MNNKKPVCGIKPLLYSLLAFFMLNSQWVKSEPLPRIALIMDDMGLNRELGQTAIQLSGAVTYSFLVNERYAHELADMATQEGKELMLHAPMQAIAKRDHEVGELTQTMSAQKFSQLFVQQLNSIPNIKGVNNHKGSLLTQDYQSMARIMHLIKQSTGTELFFVDSKTVKNSIADQVAEEFGLPVLARDVFLDHGSPKQAEIRRQFRRLIEIAQTEGFALGIAHPRINTLKILQEELSRLNHYGVRLVSVSELMDYRKNIVAGNELHSVREIEPIIMPAKVPGEFDVF